MWKFFNTQFHSAAWNMALDEVLVMEVARQDLPGVIRVYGWKPWALSLGYTQKAEQFDLDAIVRRGYDFVRRATGGRAVFHANEVTYSVIAPIHDKRLGKNLHETYRVLSRAILCSLERAGLATLKLEKSKPEPVAGNGTNGVTDPCFSSTARYEITWQGRKLVGSAQRRMQKVVQQHGSILLGPEYLWIADFLNLDEQEKRKYRTKLERNAVSADEVMGHRVAYKDVAQHFGWGFETVLQEQVKTMTMSDRLREKTSVLAATKYATDVWSRKY